MMFKEKSVLRNRYITMIVSSGGASAITFFSYPLLAFFYSIESFGHLGVINAYALILSTLIVLRFDYFILSAKNKFLMARYLISAVVLSVFLSAVTFFIGGVYWLLYDTLSIVFIALLMALFSLNNVFNFYLISMGKIKCVNYGKFIKAVITVVSQILIWYFFSSNTGLLLGVILGLFITVLYLTFQSKMSIFYCINKIKNKKITILSLILKSLNNNKNHIKLQLPQTGLNSITNNAMPIIIEQLFGLKVAGAILLVEKFIKMPVGLVIDAIRPLLITELSKISIVQASNKVRKLVLFSFIPAILIISIHLFIDFDAFGVSINLYKNISYLIFPVLTMASAMLCSAPVLCLYQSQGLSSLLFKVEFLRFILISFISGYFYYNDIFSEVVFYHIISFLFFMIPITSFIVYFYRGKNINVRFS